MLFRSSQKKRKRRTREYIESHEQAYEILAQADEHLRYALYRCLCMYTIGKFPSSLKGKKSVRYTQNLQKIPEEDLKRIKKDLKFFRRTPSAYMLTPA